MAVKPIRIKRTKKAPIPFSIFIEQEDGSDVEHKFHAKPKLKGELILDVTAAGVAGADYQAAAIRRFFDEQLVKEDRDRFWELLKGSDDNPIDFEELSEVMENLIEEYGEEVPTAAPSGS